MTEKRFTLKKFLSNEYGLLDDEKEIAYVSHKSAFTICDLLNCLNEENDELKKELKEFKDFIYSDEKILCYSCVNCLSKGIYQVECSEKGKVDVHGSCFAYWKKEVEE